VRVCVTDPSQPKGVKPKMRGRRLRGDVYCQEALKQKCLKQVERKTRALCTRELKQCYTLTRSHTNTQGPDYGLDERSSERTSESPLGVEIFSSATASRLISNRCRLLFPWNSNHLHKTATVHSDRSTNPLRLIADDKIHQHPP
jgi:hypothetical protein